MVSSQAKNAYQQTVMQANIHPVQLIHMLYERVLVHLELAEVAILENQPQSRGEHLGKVIAIVTELYVSVQPDDSDSSQFLLGLYEAILEELPSVSESKDVEVVRRSHRYLQRLKEVWEETAMQENGLAQKTQVGTAAPVDPVRVSEGIVSPSAQQGVVSGQLSFSV